MPKTSTKQSDLEKNIISYVNQFKEDWETGTTFITEKVAFEMRNLIRQLRKNYWGIFDVPTDPQTGRDKVWIPLTESTCENIVKNIDIDTKDINVVSKQPGKNKISFIVREILQNNLKKIDFGEKLNDLERRLAIDGTVVWKINKNKKDDDCIADIRPVDLLNFYIDPTAYSIQDTPVVIERSLLTPDEVESMDEWDNTEDIKGETNINPNDGEIGYSYERTSNTEFVEVFELWGLIPKKFITGNKNDTDKIEGHIVVSGIGQDKNQRVHLVEKNKDKQKPYEECWLTRVPGRWYGKGIAEKLLMLQLYINIIVNVRITRSMVTQLGLFKIKDNSGITPQMLKRLAVNGGIRVKNMEDVEQMIVDEASEASYKDEEVARNWSERVSQAFEVATGEEMPATMTATMGAISQKNAQSSFALIKEGISMFLERVLNGHILDIIQNNLSEGKVVRVLPKADELIKIDEQYAESLVYQWKEDQENMGEIVDPDVFREVKKQIMEEMRRMGKERYIKLSKKIDLKDYITEVFVGNERIDKNLLVTNLLNMLNIAPEYKKQIIPQVFELLGVNFDFNVNETDEMSPENQQQLQELSKQFTPQNAERQTMEANNLKTRP